MRRALQLAANGEGHVAPNPMVGAVIVADGRIIGEGYHAKYGGPHAEVNAINSVKKEDWSLLSRATIYVSLEPCAHFGKTPPCANLIVEKGLKKVVIASPDPNPKVAGKGIKILRDAGIEVVEGVLRDKADELNKRFLTFHRLHRPWILLKWARSADDYIATIDENGNPKPYKFSNDISTIFMHRERARNQAIMVGRITEETDHPRLDVRYWGGDSPKIVKSPTNHNLKELIKKLYEENISSLMVEGGSSLLSSFIREDLFDEIRIETSDFILGRGVKSPSLPKSLTLINHEEIRKNIVETYIP